MLALTVRQTQVDTARTDSTGFRYTTPLVFRAPVTVWVGTSTGDVREQVQLDQRDASSIDASVDTDAFARFCTTLAMGALVARSLGLDTPEPQSWHALIARLLDSGAHFYEVYETSDGCYMAVGSIEPRFYALLLEGLGLDPASLPQQFDRANWPSMKRRFADIFRTRTRDEWTHVFADTDACVTPVLTPEEAAQHPHAVARGAFRTAFGVLHPSGAPRLSRSRAPLPEPPPRAGEHSDAVLASCGFGADEISALRACGALASNQATA
jgi:crotonobetainyl-CoA:carnitine CoA-transferase CaiB-like acyl-CoA transferase